MDVYILKLGGSAITDKRRNRLSVNSKLLKDISKVIGSSLKSKKFGLVIVHGAGAFGHKFVNDYGIKDGLFKEKHFEGFSRTHYSMESLNKQVVEALLDEKVNAITIQPSACIIQRNKKIVKFDTEIIKKFLSLGLVPVLYGDVVFDEALNASVVSGDAIVSYLAKDLNASKVFFGSDVEGIYDSNPKSRNAKLVPFITEQNFEKVFSGTSSSNAIDVTQGMRGKLSEIRENIRNKECFVFRLTPKNLSELLEGKSINCTKIYF